jgi:hypothetical protein
MSSTFYSFLHVGTILLLTGWTFYAFAAPVETRKGVMIITGVLSLLALIAGFGLQAKLQVGWPGWLIVKMVCWLGLSAMAGFGYRKRQAAGALTVVASVLVLIAVAMVYTRAF